MLKKYNLLVLTILSINLIEMMPKIKDVNITINIPNQLTVIWQENNLMLS